MNPLQERSLKRQITFIQHEVQKEHILSNPLQV